MQVIFAGGASGVGASCTAIELAGQWFVVDAGVRVGRQEDPLPDLSLLEDKDVRAIFVTHAHADHIGALPLLHQAFPSVPIFASRATGLLMEVMLADALKIMNKRAVEEMELPLYPPDLVARMLDHVRPLPVGETLTLPALPGVTITTSRAGHIAGAISLGFAASDGSLVISGDISSTPQRTVLGAVPPALERPDLLVLESTYGARLHPNRQAEELRFVQAVAESIANGGHTLIPCFGLGRGQELLLILQAAQEQGQIPTFPIYVDGLVRRVCSTYLLMPEALTPRLQRQIRKGYLPFTGAQVSYVRDERDRERVLAGPPACILSSSGMLTGGPSVWYAARLASNPQASILITGYQDEESPGKRLLDLAEQQTKSLEIGGNTVQVRCNVAKYSLSAHADGGELAAYANALRPRKIALVHGDRDARAALQEKLGDFEVLLPDNGKNLSANGSRPAGRRVQSSPGAALAMLPTAIGKGEPLSAESIKQMWEEVCKIDGLRVVTARELAVIWYGEATEERTAQILDILAQDYDQRYFVRQHALEEAFRVRGQQEEMPDDFLNELVGSILLMQLRFEHSKPALCMEIEPPAFIRAILPQGVAERTRFPYSAILEVIGTIPEEIAQSRTAVATFLADLVKVAHTQRRHISLHALAQQCQEGATYTLSELCQFADVPGNDLVSRLAVAKLLHLNPLLFTQQVSVLEGEGLALYTLAPEWREALQEPEKDLARPDQHKILTILEQHLGSPPDLVRRSVDPDTGSVTLHFQFPIVAAVRYQEAIDAAALEADVPITISPRTNQTLLGQVARQALPSGLTPVGLPSLYNERQVVQYTCTGQVSIEELTLAQERFHERTGWHLEVKGDIITSSEPLQISENEDPLSGETVEILPQHQAMQIAQQILGSLPGYYRVGAEIANLELVVRFHFPEVAQRRYAEEIKQVESTTGWHVRLHPTVHQEALVSSARKHLPAGLTCVEPPSLYHNEHKVRLRYQGSVSAEEIAAARQAFNEETGWRLELLLSEKNAAQIRAQVPQSEAIAQTWVLFSGMSDLYRVEADNQRKILWLHFHFPDVASQRYMEQLATLKARAGWEVKLHPYTHQKALMEMAYRLLLPEIQASGKTTVYPERKVLALTHEGHTSTPTYEQIRQHFLTETGWTLELHALPNETRENEFITGEDASEAGTC
jgi:Cft2 family RNA processing exonuclease